MWGVTLSVLSERERKRQTNIFHFPFPFQFPLNNININFNAFVFSHKKLCVHSQITQVPSAELQMFWIKGILLKSFEQ